MAQPESRRQQPEPLSRGNFLDTHRNMHHAQGINAALAGDKRFVWQFREPFYDALHEKADSEGWNHFNQQVLSVAADLPRPRQ